MPTSVEQRSRLKVALAYPYLPPRIDGIGDHTANLAAALANHVQANIYADDTSPSEVYGIRVQRCFSMGAPASLSMLVSRIVTASPDWLLLQYNPFSWGRWGLNLQLPAQMAELKRMSPKTRIALIVHEPFVPLTSMKFGVMTTWQRWQLWRLGRIADVIFFSIEPWVLRFKRWYADKQVHWLPVGSNIAVTPASRDAMRRKLRIGPTTIALGCFTSAHPSHLIGWVDTATAAIKSAGYDTVLVALGSGAKYIKQRVKSASVIVSLESSADEISRHFSALDLYLAPFSDGVSSRRGSFMTGIQHGVATLTNLGPSTGPALHSAASTAFIGVSTEAEFGTAAKHLTEDPGRRRELGATGQAFYTSHFDWPVLARQLCETLALSGPERAIQKRPAEANVS